MEEEADSCVAAADASREIELLRQQLAQMKRDSEASLAAIREELRLARGGTYPPHAQPRRPVPLPRKSLCKTVSSPTQSVGETEDEVDPPPQTSTCRVILVRHLGDHESAPTTLTAGGMRGELQAVLQSPQPATPPQTYAQVFIGSPVRDDNSMPGPAANNQSQIDGAVALLDGQVRTMQDTLKSVERHGGSSPSDSSHTLRQLRG